MRSATFAAQKPRVKQREALEQRRGGRGHVLPCLSAHQVPVSPSSEAQHALDGAQHHHARRGHRDRELNARGGISPEGHDLVAGLTN